MVKQREAGGYESFDEGKYDVTFGEFWPKDNEGLPIPKLVNWGGEDVMVVRYRMQTTEGEGPPGSVNVEELSLLMRAFGCDPSKLPGDIREELDDALMEACIQLEDSKAGTVVHVNKSGWIYKVEGMSPPPGEAMMFRLSRFSSLDEEGVPCPKPSQKNPSWGLRFFVRMKVVGGDYDGVEVPCLVPYPYEVIEAGELTLPVKKDKVTGNTVPTKAHERVVKFEKMFLDDKYDPESGPSDNVVATMAKHVSGKLAMGQVNDYGWVDLDGLMKPPAQVESKVLPKEQPPLSEEEEEALSRIEYDTIGDDQLRDLMSRHACGPVFKEGTWVFTKDGLVWAKDVLAGWSDKNNLPRRCSEWNKAQRSLVARLLDGELAGQEWFPEATDEEEEGAF